MRGALLTVLSFVSLAYAADETVPGSRVPMAVTVATAAMTTVDRPSCRSISLGECARSAVAVVQSAHLDDDDAAVDDDGDDASLALSGLRIVSIGTVAHRRPVAVPATRAHASEVPVGIDAPRAPPSALPVV